MRCLRASSGWLEGGTINPIIEYLKQTEGTVFVNEDGYEDDFTLRPPLSERELSAFEAGLPCALPAEMREVLRFARGFDGALDGIDFADASEFGREDIFPHARTLAVDGYGNFWVVDFTAESKFFSPIYYVCHDPPVIVFQTDSLLHFVREVVRFGNKPWKSEIDDVHQAFSSRIWRENPCVLSLAQCLATGDAPLIRGTVYARRIAYHQRLIARLVIHVQLLLTQAATIR